MGRALNWYRSLNEPSKALSIFSSTIVFALLLFFITSTQMGCLGYEAMEPYKKSQKLIDNYVDSIQRPPNLEERYFTVFQNQQKILSVRKKHHLQLGVIFFSNYYGVIILTIMFSCAGGVVLFLIANQGWSNSSVTLKALFLALALIIAVCSLFPTVFKQQENFEENLKYYMSYTKAEMNILDQLASLNNPLFGKTKDEKKPDAHWKLDTALYYHRLDSMIHLNERTINNLTNYVLNINAKEIKSMADVYRSINNSLLNAKDTIRINP